METINYKINVDTKGAVKETDKLSDSLKQVDKEAEKTSKSVDDVASNGGAIAILDQLTGGLATRFKDAYEATKLFNFSLKGTRTALIATGVGAFVVALGLVVAYWDEIVGYIEGANENLEQQNKLIQDNIEILKVQLSRNELLEKSLIAQGKSTEEILILRDKILQSLQLETLASLQNLRAERDKVIALAKQVTLRERLSKEYTLSGGKKGGGLIDDEERQAIDDLNLAIEQATLSLETLAFQREVLSKQGKEDTPKAEVFEKRTASELENGLTPEDNIILGSKELLNEKLLELDKEYSDEIAQRAQNEILAAEAAAQERIFLEEQVKNAKIGIAFQTLGLLGSLAKEGSALAKGAAVAQATISGFQGAQNAFTTAAANPITTLFPAFPFIQAGLAGAFSLAQINKILSTKAVETSAPSLGGGGGGRSAPAPSFSLVQGSASNQIANSFKRSNEPLKAFVVSKDMTSNQELDRTIQQSAVL